MTEKFSSKDAKKGNFSKQMELRKMSFRSAGLLYGSDAHHLDHLAVVCCLMEIPLITTDEEIAESAQKYYPGLEVVHMDTILVANYVVNHFEVIFYTIPRLLFEEIFFFAQQFQRKKIHTVWCPHGNSDKGHASIFMEALELEEVALVYGPKMIEFLIKKGVFNQLKAHVTIGNLRYTYYRKNKEFYDTLIDQKIVKKQPNALTTLLYAPTWNDAEKSSSFYDATPTLIENLPPSTNLIIKLHPNLIHQGEGQTERLLMRYEDHPHVLFLTKFSPIYPILNYVDVYIGDMSSIGYDALIFNKPMFFLNQNNRDAQEDLGLYLFKCGIEVAKKEYPNFYTIMKKHLASDTTSFTPLRKQTYDYTFSKEKPWVDLRTEILNTFSKFSDL
ncbi:MAG: CDP-glycerol glycerophosphotransferase family protein [Chlamydiota bacterium]